LVDIISKRDGPRREDVPLKQLIQQNRGIITRLADQISGGGYSASKRQRSEPQAEGLIIHVGGSQKKAAEVVPTISSEADTIRFESNRPPPTLHVYSGTRSLNRVTMSFSFACPLIAWSPLTVCDHTN
jgi:hypothetical protein